MILFFDTETTGLLRSKEPPDHPGQPMLVQLACLLYDSTGTELESLNVLVKTDGWDIPPVVVAIHGISKEKADAYGLPLSEVLDLFDALVAKATLVVAHNISFDSKVMSIAYAKLGRSQPTSVPGYCTMEAATPICKLQTRWGKPKWPKLSEAYKHFFNEDLTNAHEAMNDVRATAKIYFAINKPTV